MTKAKFRYTADLHGHSVYSDGVCQPAEIVKTAIENKVDILALTDHNTVEGLDEFISAIETANRSQHIITGIPGIEISTDHGHIIFLFGNLSDLKSFAPTVKQNGPNKLDDIIESGKNYKKYVIIPHPEVPLINSFSFNDIDKFLNQYPQLADSTGIESINGQSLLMPPFMLKKHQELTKENKKRGWNRKLFGNSDYHTDAGVGVGITVLTSETKIETADQFISGIQNGFAGGKIKVNKTLTIMDRIKIYKDAFIGSYNYRKSLRTANIG